MDPQNRSGLAVSLTCRDMKASVAFYRDRLRFSMKESWPDDDAPSWCNLVLERQSVMLGAAMNPEQVRQLCAHDPDSVDEFVGMAEAFRDSAAGVGVTVYVCVPDVDDYDRRLRERGVSPLREPRTQFYGIREIVVVDPDGYRLVFYSPVLLKSCQSCGMPLPDAAPGQMYCVHCTSEDGRLRPYDQVLEGTARGYFMQIKKLDPASAREAARDHLAGMPAWAGRGAGGS